MRTARDHIETISLHQVIGKYTALSYCAGDPNKTATILLDGVHFNVFANLGYALLEARHFWKKFPGVECLLRVDQICINQIDFTETSHQVEFMHRIYQSAKQVLLCLSVENCSNVAIDWLLEVSKTVPITLDDMRQGNLERMSSEASDCKYWSRLRQHFQGNTHDEKLMAGWLSPYNVIDSPWWKRAWVYQEFMVSSEAHFIFGQSSFQWTSLRAFLLAFFEIQAVPLLNDFQLLKKERRLSMECFRRLRRVRDRWKKLKQTTTMKAVEFIVQSKTYWPGSHDLKTLLRSSRHCISSDSRDMIFAFLGLAQPYYAILIHYSTENGIVKDHSLRKWS